MQGLTKRQEQTLDYIRDCITVRGYPPTLREIGVHMGIRSTNGVNDHLRALERKGYLTREDMKSRALKLSGQQGTASAEEPTPADEPRGGLPFRSAPANESVEVPVLGRVAAGLPLLAEENVLETLHVDPSLIRGRGEIFGLRVTGDSMIEAGILSGDIIFVRRQNTASRGEIVVALIGDEATVKYFYPSRDFVRLEPANSNMAPILVRASDFKPTMLLGVVAGLYRRM